MEPTYTLLYLIGSQSTSHVANCLDRFHADIDVRRATAARAALECLETTGIDCIVSEYRLPDSDGLELFEVVRETHPDLPFILCLDEEPPGVATDAVQAGVTDCVREPPRTDQCEVVAHRIRRAVDCRRQHAAYRDLFDGVDDVAMVLDSDTGKVIDANAATADHWGIDRSELTRLTIADLGITVPAADESSGIDRLLARHQSQSPIEWRCDPGEQEPFWLEAHVHHVTIGGRDRTLVTACDITDRRRRERATDALLSTARDLMTMTEREGVCETAVETVDDLFDADASRAYLLDHEVRTEPSAIRPVATTDAVRTAMPDDEIEATVGVDDIVTAEHTSHDWNRRSGDEAPGRLSVELELPLGHHGLLYVGATEKHTFEQYERDLIRIFAAHVASALDRADRDRLLRERKQELTAKRDELTVQNHINEVIRDVNRALVHVSTREDIERLVCERLAAADRYRYAWIGRYDAESTHVTPVTQAGIGDSNELSETVSVGQSSDETALSETVSTAEVVVVPEISRSSLPEDRIEHARSNGYRSVAYVPITYQNVLYDVLVVYAGKRDVFGSDERAVLAELGETIGSAINTAQQHATQAGTGVVDLTFSFQDDRSILVSLSSALECKVELRSWSLQSQGPLYLFVRLENVDIAAVTPWAAGVPAVKEVVKIDDEAGLVKIGVDDAPVVEYVAEQRTHLTAASATNGRGTVVATARGDADLRQFVELFETQFDGAELRSRDVQHDRPTYNDPWSQIADRLTDRQHEVLQVAFHGGFFDQPRRKNGEALADLLNITQPTFHQHLRAGQRELLAGVFDRHEQA